MDTKSILLFDDDQNNSNPTIDKDKGILFVKIPGCKGMSTLKIKRYIKAVQHMDKIDAAYFDWDLTISRQNIIDYESYKSNSVKQNLEIYFGSEKRQMALKQLFRALKNKGAPFYILTRNATAYYKEERKFFKEMINKLQGNKDFTMDRLFYCPLTYTKSGFIQKLITEKTI